jgi:hypothetical protein
MQEPPCSVLAQTSVWRHASRALTPQTPNGAGRSHGPDGANDLALDLPANK